MSGNLNMTENNISSVNSINITNGITMMSKKTNYYTENNITNGMRPIVISLNISTISGINNNTHIYTNNHSLSNFNDLYITQNDVPLNFCLEENSTSDRNRIHINVTGNGSVKIAYGNLDNSSLSNCDLTNTKYHGYANSEYLDALQNRITNFEYSSIIKVDNINSNVWWGLADQLLDAPAHGISEKQYTTNAYYITYNISATVLYDIGILTTGATYRFMFRRYGNQVDYYINDTYMKTVATTLPNSAIGLGMNFADANGAVQQWSYMSPWYSSADSWATWGNEVTIPTNISEKLYCVTINSDGVLKSTLGAC